MWSLLLLRLQASVVHTRICCPFLTRRLSAEVLPEAEKSMVEYWAGKRWKVCATPVK